MDGFARAGSQGVPAPPGDFVVAGGVRVHYVRAGEGQPVIYVHGAKGSVYDFTLSVGARLAERYTAVALDRPGAGFSARPAKGDTTPQAQAAVLRAAATELGLRRPILIGHSLGAAVTLAWALAAPDEVAAVVTLCGYVLPLGGGPPWATALMRHPVALRGMGVLGRSRLGRPLVRSAVARVFSPGSAPDDYVRIAPRLALQDAALISDGEDRRAVESGLATLRPLYPGLRPPLVILVGAQDRIVPPAVSDHLHALVPASELVRVPGAGHMPQFTAPDAVVAAIDRAAELAGRAAGFASPRDRG